MRRHGRPERPGTRPASTAPARPAPGNAMTSTTPVKWRAPSALVSIADSCPAAPSKSRAPKGCVAERNETGWVKFTDRAPLQKCESPPIHTTHLMQMCESGRRRRTVIGQLRYSRVLFGDDERVGPTQDRQDIVTVALDLAGADPRYHGQLTGVRGPFFGYGGQRRVGEDHVCRDLGLTCDLKTPAAQRLEGRLVIGRRAVLAPPHLPGRPGDQILATTSTLRGLCGLA